MSTAPSHRMRFHAIPALGLVLLAPGAVAQIEDARKEIVQPIPPGTSAALPQGSPDWQDTRSLILRNADTPILAAVDEWKRLQQSDGYGFDAYSRFIMAHPGWPGEDRMRRLAETGINPLAYSPPAVVAFFRQFPPRTATGGQRFAIALAAMGNLDEARLQARAAWRMGAMAPQDEAQMLSQFGASLTADDHAAHADAALWARNPASAQRALPYITGPQQPVIAARIAMQQRTADADALVQAAQPFARGNAGFIADRVGWLSASGNAVLARSILAGREPITMRPANVERWYELLLSNARAAASDGQWQAVYDIASRLDDAYAPDTDVSTRPIGERDDYTSLAWLAGTAALDRLNRPRDAIGLFDRYASAARSPQTMSKGFYWAGRAALAAGDRVEADRHLALAAAYPDQYYGQLARERTGQTIPAPGAFAAPVVVTDNDRAAFDASSLVRAAKALGAVGRWQDQSFFLRAIAASVVTDADRAMANELAAKIGRPDLGVMVGRRARADGGSGYALASFPSVAVPGEYQQDWTMIHAIARQESQFDKTAVSHAGARGLMQLMPGTARETAGRVGLAYMPENLTADPAYNIQLGSTYFQRMLSYYGGSYPLAVAAYNAGPGNVNKWLAANGDPRTGAVDILRWIEAIPIYETRNYVQRVLENAVIYDAMRAQTAGATLPPAPLSRYLGKNGIG